MAPFLAGTNDLAQDAGEQSPAEPVNTHLTDLERDALEAARLGVSLEEYQGAKAIEQNTAAIPSDPPVEASPLPDEPTTIGPLETVLDAGIPSDADQVVVASRLTPEGWADKPVAIKHQADGSSIEVEAKGEAPKVEDPIDESSAPEGGAL